MARIGITFSHSRWPDDDDNIWRMRQYIGAVEDAGAAAEPLFLAAETATVDLSVRNASLASRASIEAARLDGLLISGGADLPPAMYDELPIQNADLDYIVEGRPPWELALLHEFVSLQKPILGICYGCQLLNVWRGGALLQDVPTQSPEAIEHRTGKHRVRVLDDTHLRDVVGLSDFDVVTSHHQAISRLADRSSVGALAPDGLAESIEFDDAHWLLGVQWHPERDRGSEATKRLFAAFVRAADGDGLWPRPQPNRSENRGL